MLPKLPIGEQSLHTIHKEKMLYVDKTMQIYRLVTGSRYSFLSRPRRFGKSLTLSTIDELFSGNKELFEGLWIENHWDWSKINPVIHISFSTIGYQEIGLLEALVRKLTEIAKLYEINLDNTTPGMMLKELTIKLCAKKGNVVILIDEYDKPIIDYLEKENIQIAKENQKALKTFYSGLKDKDSQDAMRLLLITGVSKFSQVSIFSDLNYLDDITLNPNFGDLVGYTQKELEKSFKEYLKKVVKNSKGHYNRKTLLADIKEWYNGYSWNMLDFVYNPFSILQFFNNEVFQDYWFKTGTPTFLMKVLREKRFFNLNELKVNKILFDSYDLDNLDARALLFQTGYLTIKHIETRTGQYTLNYPNREVEEAMHDHLIGSLLHTLPADSTRPVLQLEEAFIQNNPAKVVQIINTMLKDLPSHVVNGKDEHFYHSLVHLHFRYLGLFINSEVHTSDGRMDAVVQTDNHIFILEFKLDETAAIALQQIHDKKYADKYALENKPIVCLGINFNSLKKSVDDWTQELITF
jgi:Predicted AAA-ATPase/PD-(D/E)XK nuclease superfamily